MPDQPYSEAVELLTEALEYVRHDNWRCDHKDRWPWDPDCMCGLTLLEKRARQFLIASLEYQERMRQINA